MRTRWPAFRRGTRTRSWRIYFVAQDGSLVRPGFIGDEGAFDVVLPAGTYSAHLNGPVGLVLGSAAVSGSIVQDLVVPRSTLCGSVEYVGTKHAFARGPRNEVSITLEREDGTRITSGFVRGEGSYAFLGLEPGIYVLSTKPWILKGSLEGRARIEIVAGEEAVELPIEITDP